MVIKELYGNVRNKLPDIYTIGMALGIGTLGVSAYSNVELKPPKTENIVNAEEITAKLEYKRHSLDDLLSNSDSLISDALRLNADKDSLESSSVFIRERYDRAMEEWRNRNGYLGYGGLAIFLACFCSKSIINFLDYIKIINEMNK